MRILNRPRGACLALIATAALLAAFSSAARAADEHPPAALPSFAEPAVSPDGTEIAFCSAGEIWTVRADGADGGAARLLVSNPATESRPLYSPDGTRLAFVSTRTGNGDVYVLTFATGDVRRLTFDDAPEQLDAWSRDGKWVYFSSPGRDMGPGNNDVYRVRAAGGTPMPVVADEYANEFAAAPSPDGKTLAFAAGGMASRDWWRKGHTHWDETRLWLMRDGLEGGDARFEPLTPEGNKDLWPMWAADGKRLYYISDRNGVQNVWSMALSAVGGKSASDGASPPEAAKPVTRFTEGRVLWPSISADGRTIVFERDFGIWRLDTRTGDAKPLGITLRGAPAVGGVQHVTYVGFRDLALSPDGRKIAFVAHGDVFAASSGGGQAVRVTHTAAAEGQLDWAPDSRRLAYVSDRAGSQNVFVHDFATDSELSVTHGESEDSRPRFAPDGRSIAFIRDGRDLIVADLPTRKQRTIARGLGGGLPPFDDAASPFVWSPKGNWIAYIANGSRGFDNLFVAPVVAGGEATGGAKEPRQVTFFANTGSNSVSWSPDGRFLLFGTGQRTEDYQLARIDLTPRPPNFAEDQFRGLFQEQERTTRPNGPREPVRPDRTTDRPPRPTTVPATLPADLFAATPTTGPASRPAALGPPTRPADAAERFSLDNVWQRVSLLPVGMDVDYQTVSPDARTILIVGSVSGRQNLYLYPADGSEQAVPRQITSTTGSKTGVQFAPDGREVYCLDGGAVRAVSMDPQHFVRDVNVTAEVEVDFDAERAEVGRQAWKWLKLNFFDPDLNGVDWERVRQTYFPRFAGARTPDELRRLMSLMVGELNASHLGTHGPSRSSPAVGRLGVRFDRLAYERKGELRVADVTPFGPAAVAGLKVGDYVLNVDGEPVDESTNLDALLERKIGRKVALVRAANPAGRDQSIVGVLSTDAATERTLVYRAWVEANRQLVERASNGRLGYVHIPDMGKAAQARLMLDLDARAYGGDGVVVDVRGNTGGFASPYVLDVFARRGYLTMTRRGAEATPGRPYVGQRSLELPTVLVTNRESVSDAENFAEGYRALNLGKIVGEPTAGGVIFTADAQLLDGSTFRIPYSKVVARDGSPLEARPRPVDVTVLRAVGEGAAGKDSQLDAAVRTLLKQIDGR